MHNNGIPECKTHCLEIEFSDKTIMNPMGKETIFLTTDGDGKEVMS